MSPSEHQLRAALHDGEGQPLDSDAVLGRAQRARRERRRTWSAVGGSVGAVLAVAVAVTAISSQQDTRTAGGQKSSSAQTAAQLPNNGQTRSPSGGPSGTGTAMACPSKAPRLETPPGGNFGADQDVLPTDVTSITVCVYQPESAAGAPDTSGVAASYTLTGTDATELAKTINALPSKSPGACTQDIGPSVLLQGSGPTGTIRQAVGQAGGCGLITNGTAKRYSRDAMQSLLQRGLPQMTTGRVTHGPAPS